MKKSFLFIFVLVFSLNLFIFPFSAFAGDFISGANQSYIDRVEDLGFPVQQQDKFFITADTDGHLFYFQLTNPAISFYDYTYDNVEYMIYYATASHYVYTASLNNGWSQTSGGDLPLYVAFGPSEPSNINDFWSTAVSSGAIPTNRSYDFVFGGNQIIYDGGNARIQEFISDYLSDYPWFNSSSSSGGSGSENNGYNDSSFKGLVTNLFDHLFSVLLYGEEEEYDGTDVDDSVQWLEDLSDDMEDITIKLNQAPNYIRNGFTAVSSGQTAINDFFTGISTAIPIIYYGIVGILTIIIIRKIIGR